MSPDNKANAKKPSRPDLQRTLEGILERLRHGMDGLLDSLVRGRTEPQPIPVPIPVPVPQRRRRS